MELYAQLLTPELRPLFLVSMFIFGSCIGSFLNVCIWRMPLNESVVFAPSHCTSCNAEIMWYDNIPLISYLVLGGKCRKCHQHYTMRYFLVELFTGLLFLLLTALAPTEDYSRLLPFFTTTAVMIAVGFIDAEHSIIPNKLSYFLLIMGVVYSGIFGIDFQTIFAPIEGAKGVIISIGTALTMGILLSIFAILGKRITKTTALGWGDVKIIAALGAVFGLFGVLIITTFASLTGIIWGVSKGLAQKRKMAKLEVRFGLFLAIATIVYEIAYLLISAIEA